MVQCPLCREFVDELLPYNEEEMCIECVNELDDIEKYRQEYTKEKLQLLKDQYWEK